MTKVEWHPYPKETPEEHEILSQFFVTVKMKGINGQTVTKTEFGRWMPSVSKTGSSYCFGKPKSQEVTAWARIDMPDPYDDDQSLVPQAKASNFIFFPSLFPTLKKRNPAGFRLRGV